MPANKGHVRRSQLITTYGVGAIVALGDESFMVTGIDRWNVAAAELREPRLERELSVRGFVSPPANGDDDIPVTRFPRWHSCPECRRLDDHKRLAASYDTNRCSECNRPLVPSRFVIACGNGHTDDFPYVRWVHRGRPADPGPHELSIESLGASAALRDIRITCRCGAERSMDKAFDRYALRDITRCFGNRPWLGTNEAGCDEQPRTLQRGASNVWFGSHRSVISIPPWSENAFQRLSRHWDIFRALSGTALESAIEAADIGRGTTLTTADFIQAVNERKRQQEGEPGPMSELDLRRDEYRALVAGKPEEPQGQFAATESPLAPTLTPTLSKLMLVTRLREVRALEGFTRILPPAGTRPQLSPLFTNDPGWRPAIEVNGEGLFVTINPATLSHWEQRPDVIARARKLDQRYAARAERWGNEADRTISARFILIHTLSHALIDQLALEAGYPAASLRERLYVADDMQGMLIYTATSDSAGSLGGLIAHGEPRRFDETLRSAVARYGWCSADPICIETIAQGAEGLNIAACHACALLPETSCEEMNCLLDRGLIVGTPESPSLGFLADLEKDT
jgi:hypothetical protein